MTEIHAFDPDGTPSPGAQTALDSALAAIPGSILDPQILATISDSATATGSAIEDRYRRSISVMEHGAVADGVTDDSPAINAALAACGAQGGGEVYFPPGTYAVTQNLIPQSNVHMRGASAGASKLWIPVGDSARNSIVYRATETAPIHDVTISDLTFEGRWEEFQSQLNASGLVTLKYVTRLKIERCIFKNSRWFALNLNVCNDVVVRDNVFENATRDMCAVWGSPNVTITGNRFYHNDDDCISVSWEAPISAPLTRSQIIITGNHLEDTGAIRTQVPSGAIISNNTISRPHGIGIYLSIVNVARSNTGTGHSNIVSNNVIRDVVDRMWNVADGPLDGTINLRTYMLIDSNVPQTGGGTAEPGQPSAAGTIVNPYGSNYAVSTMEGNVGAIRRPHGVIVEGNVCKRTLPPVAKYSDWGYGLGYSMDGWRDRPVIERDLSAAGITVALPFSSLMIRNNILEPGDTGVRFKMFTGVPVADRVAQNIVVAGNTIKDCAGSGGVYATLGAQKNHQDIQIVDNAIDCDPYFKAANRAPGGGWSGASVTPVAVTVYEMGGVVVARNTVRNAGAAILPGTMAGYQMVIDNLIYAEAAATGYSAANKGVGTMPGIGHGKQWWYVPEGSDPAASTYGQSLVALVKDAASMPTSGSWLAGMFVYSRASGPVNGKYALGWLRLTHGSSHVAGTDWTPVYTTIT